MDIRPAIGEYVTLGRELLHRLRSPEEGPTVPAVDLQILRVQMFLIDNAAANLQELKRQQASEITEVDDELPRLDESFRPPSTSPISPPGEPV